IAAGVLTATFTSDADVVDIKLASTLASDNGGVIVNLKYNGVDHTFGDATTGILGLTIDAGDGADTFTLVDELTIPFSITGGDGNDTLIGPAVATEWTIDGVNSGSASSIVSFAGFENVKG